MYDTGTSSNFLAAAIVICFLGGILAGTIAYGRTGSGGSFLGFFIFGAILPLIGVIVACFAKPPVAAPQPPDWYGDPWQQATYRWWDGYQWTWHTS